MLIVKLMCEVMRKKSPSIDFENSKLRLITTPIVEVLTSLMRHNMAIEEVERTIVCIFSLRLAQSQFYSYGGKILAFPYSMKEFQELSKEDVTQL